MKHNPTIYLVRMSAGEYEDAYEVILAAYPSARAAKNHADKAKARSLEICGCIEKAHEALSEAERTALEPNSDPGCAKLLDRLERVQKWARCANRLDPGRADWPRESDQYDVITVTFHGDIG